MTAPPRDTPRAVLARWLTEISRRNDVYWRNAACLERRAHAWAVPNIVFSSLAGLGATAQALGDPAPWVLWASAGAGVLASVTASLARVWRYHERAGASREVAKRYAILLHDAEAALAEAAPECDARDVLARVRAEFNRLVEAAEDPPTLPQV